MRNIFISSLAVLLIFVFVASAQARDIPHAGDIHVVYKPGTSACTTGDYYHNTIQDAADAIKVTGTTEYPGCDCNGREGCYPDDDGDANADQQDGKSIIICPGTYIENVVMIFGETCTPSPNMTIRSYTNDPADVTVEAADPNMNVFYIHGPGLDGITVSGLTIKGAIDNPTDPPCTINCNPNYCPIDDPNCCDGECIPCINKYADDGTPIYSNQDPPQHCAGIRFFCLVTGYLNNNIFTDNNNGIIIKDTAPKWNFIFNIENNEFYANKTAGINFRYGTGSYVQNNWIHDNPIGIKLIDTFNHNVVGNDIEYNDIGISIENNYYTPVNTIIYRNNLLNNTTPVSEDYPGHNYWYGPSLLIGNYWSPVGYSDDLYPLASAYVHDNDLDDDGFDNRMDNCPDVYNPDQADSNNNGMGDACDNCSGDSHILNFQTLYDAFDAQTRGNKLFVRTQAAVITEDLDIDVGAHYSKIATLWPGFDCNYTASNGKTTLKGDMRMLTGTLRIKSGALSIK